MTTPRFNPYSLPDNHTHLSGYTGIGLAHLISVSAYAFTTTERALIASTFDDPLFDYDSTSQVAVKR